MDNSEAELTLSIIRQMTGNENLLGLGSLWDAEQSNADLDEAREFERGRKAQVYFRDAIVEISKGGNSLVTVSGFHTGIHIRRIGMFWLDGNLCGTTDRVIVPLSGVICVVSDSLCGCEPHSVACFELVTFGAVARELERHMTPVSVTGDRYGIRGRISGVWRDAITVRTPAGESLIPLTAIRTIHVG